MLIDSHCHLDFPEFEEDFDAMLARASEAGIGKMVTICTRVANFPRVSTIAEAHENIYCSVGVHPHSAESEPDVMAATLIEHAAHPKTVGIGETGLDFFYDKSPRDVQERLFREHITAARETGLPIIIHTRDADNDTIRILEEEHASGGAFPGLIHCFTASRKLAERVLDLGLYISLSGIVTFKNAADIRETVRAVVPRDRILVETDAPYLAPIPKRGKRNEPAYTAHTAAYMADFLDIAPEEFAQITTDNFHRLFAKVQTADVA